ncbi:MAG: hypothetical protein ONB05_12075 [candidate division KSB1 bacterium]|nr:hypothetical protein [candidate division KSB1 bacterium]
MYHKIITHNDFDGLVSATICSYVFGVEKILFAGPSTISKAEISITEDDIVCDLPYPLECGLWFDHHEGNLEELKYRNIDPQAIEGRFDLKPSCARVIWEYFGEKQVLPAHFEDCVAEADMIDAFNYSSVDDWRRETPGKIIDATIKARAESPDEKRAYLRQLTLQLKHTPLAQVASQAKVQERYRQYQAEEEEMLRLIKEAAYFLPEDTTHQIIILDMTKHNRRPHIIKNLAYLLFPEALSVVEIHNLFTRGLKSTNLSFAMSLSLNLNSVAHSKDIGEIMRRLNIGDGHPGAAAGTVYCSSKEAMLREKERILKEIYRLWQQQ